MNKVESYKPYRQFGSYLQEQFPNLKVQKIGINAGFTCPNRDGTKGRGGCTYCNNQSFSPAYTYANKTVTEQLQEGINFFSYKYPHMHYLAYFQAYTNTYGDLERLKSLYEEALAHDLVLGLIVGTRPDCVSDELLEYFENLSKKQFLLIEYGVESTLDRSLERINRGHTWQQSVEAINRTASRGIPVGIHMIMGLPGESRTEILEHATKISELPISTLKLHQLQIIKGTQMAMELEQEAEAFHFYSEEEYVDLCIDFIELLRPDIVLERFVSQSPKELIVMPKWHLKNYEFTALFNKRMAERATWQGRKYRTM